MKIAFCSELLLLTFSVSAQAPTAVPIAKEPHHHLVLENEYVRVFRVSVPGHDATLLHQHDVPYVYVSLGPADVINAVQGKPEAHLMMADGQVGYSPGHFAHIARTDAGLVFNNVTIELLHPQGEPHNLCQKVVASQSVGPCNSQPGKSDGFGPLEFGAIPQLETDEIRVDIVQIGGKVNHTESAEKLPVLLVGISDSKVGARTKGKAEKTLTEGEFFWSEDDSQVLLSNPASKTATLFQVIFRNTRVTNSSAK